MNVLTPLQRDFLYSFLNMLKPLDLDDMKRFFVTLAENLVRRGNPERL